MGYAITLVATPASGVQALLGLTRLKISAEPAPMGSLLSAKKMGSQVIFWRNHSADPSAKYIDFAKLSETAPLLVLDIVDSVGSQSLVYFDKGQEIWSVSFSQDHEDYLAITGNVPVDMERITKEAMGADGKAGEDRVLYVAQTPALVFRDLTGFAYDEQSNAPFRAIEGDFPSPKKWWKFW